MYCARNEITPATEAARVAAETAPAAYLHVHVDFSRETQELSAKGLTYKEPGETVIEFESSPLADMTFRSNLGPQILNAREWPVYLGFPTENATATHIMDAELLLREPTGQATETEAEVPWSNSHVHVLASCEHPNKVYEYTVEARGGAGAAIVKTGQFRLGAHLGAKWCSATRHREAVASARKRAEERRHYEERVRKEREHQAAEDERFVEQLPRHRRHPRRHQGAGRQLLHRLPQHHRRRHPRAVNGLGEPVDVLVALSRGLGIGLSGIDPKRRRGRSS